MRSISRVAFLRFWFLSLAVVATCSGQSGTAGTPASLLAHYRFASGNGNEVHDETRNLQDGTIVGTFSWTDDGLELGGASYVRVPDSPSLNLSRSFSISVWYRGKGSPFRAVERPATGGTNSFRGPAFQICGDQISLAYMSDVSDQEVMNEKNLREKFPTYWPALYGSSLANLNGWSETFLGEGLEPKLQRVSDKVYYEYFGRDGTGVFQIWTGTLDTHDKRFIAAQRTHMVASGYGDAYLTEQGAMQVAKKRVYYAWPQMDHNGWQLWTASSSLDGSWFSATQRTVDGGWVPQIQVSGNAVYYMYAGSPNRGTRDQPTKPMYFAKSYLDGSDWKVIAKLPSVGQTVGGLLVDKDKVFFGYSRMAPDGKAEPVIGSMDMNGENLTEESPIGKGWGPEVVPLQAVGERVVYFVEMIDSEHDLSSIHYSIASARRDGSDWKTEPFADGKLEPGYTVYEQTGGKSYFGLTKDRNLGELRERAMLGTEGANLVNKGGAFGIGLSPEGVGTAFVNVGKDYLCRGEAPVDTAGAIASGPNLGDGVHQLTVVVDRGTIRLFVDGTESASTRFSSAPNTNDFPFLLGDGLVGTLKDVKLFNSALSSAEIARLFEAESQHFK